MNRGIKAMCTLALVCVAIGSLTRCGKKDDPAAQQNMNAGCFMAQTSSYATTAQGGCGAIYNSAQGFSGYRSQNQTGYVNGYYQQQSSYYGGAGGANLAGGCTGGYQMVVYSELKGLGCVDATNIFASGAVARYAFDGMGTIVLQGPLYNNQASGTGGGAYGGQFANNSQYNSQNSASSVLRTCDGSEICPSGLTCRSPFGPYTTGSSLGLCYY
jgi:hypothetical protein